MVQLNLVKCYEQAFREHRELTALTDYFKKEDFSYYEMAKEIAHFNSIVRNEGGSYLLIGPGRWGSSDPWLGIPVLWSDISEAKVIVESAIPGYQIEPSQGTHFFQNITSLGVGYLTIDTVRGDGYIDEGAISALESVSQGQFTRLYKVQKGLEAYIDRSSNEAIVGY